MQTERQKEYSKYLNSDSWKERRTVFRKAWGNKCVWCGSEESLHLHHMSYENLGNEPLFDVILLCKGCHLKVHRKHLRIWVFTEEEHAAFQKVKDIVCDDKKCDYLILKKSIE